MLSGSQYICQLMAGQKGERCGPVGIGGYGGFVTYRSTLLAPALLFPGHGKYRLAHEYQIQSLESRLLVLLLMFPGTRALEEKPYILMMTLGIGMEE